MTTDTWLCVYLYILMYKLYLKVCFVPLTKGKCVCGGQEAELMKVYAATLSYAQSIYLTSIIFYHVCIVLLYLDF